MDRGVVPGGAAHSSFRLTALRHDVLRASTPSVNISAGVILLVFVVSIFFPLRTDSYREFCMSHSLVSLRGGSHKTLRARTRPALCCKPGGQIARWQWTSPITRVAVLVTCVVYTYYFGEDPDRPVTSPKTLDPTPCTNK